MCNERECNCLCDKCVMRVCGECVMRVCGECVIVFHVDIVVVTQVSLLNAAKEVANSLVAVLEPAKTAAGKSPSDPAVQEVKAKAKVSHVIVM